MSARHAMRWRLLSRGADQSTTSIVVKPATARPSGKRAGLKRYFLIASVNFLEKSRSWIGGSTSTRSTRPSALTQNFTRTLWPFSSLGRSSKGGTITCLGSGWSPPRPPPPVPGPLSIPLPGPTPPPVPPPVPGPAWAPGPALSPDPAAMFDTSVATVALSTLCSGVTGEIGASMAFEGTFAATTAGLGGGLVAGRMIYATDFSLPLPPPSLPPPPRGSQGSPTSDPAISAANRGSSRSTTAACSSTEVTNPE